MRALLRWVFWVFGGGPFPESSAGVAARSGKPWQASKVSALLEDEDSLPT